MYLIVAEKPSLARNIAAAVGGAVRRNGYLECPGYLVTWAFGHLFSLVDIEDYQGGMPASGKARWTLDNLPCIPTEFRFELRRGENRKVDPGIRGQFDVITSLVNRPDVEAVVNAGDADREGEIIVRTCVRFALRSKKPMKRLWLPDQTPETVRAALASLEDDDKYDDLANEGYARTYIDWLYGTNLTRYATLKSGKFLRVGRVIVPIVRAVYDRDMEIRNFVPQKYYSVRSAAKTGGETVELISKNRYDADKADEARAYADRLNAQEAVVTDKSSKTDRMFPGKLFSLSTLQNLLGKKYKMSMNDSLATVQKLYEEGYLTYPRTNSEYLSQNERDKVRQILSGVSKLGYPVAFRQSKSIFDDSKIESLDDPHYNYVTDFPSDDTGFDELSFHRINTGFCYVNGDVYVVDNSRSGKMLAKYRVADDSYDMVRSFAGEYWDAGDGYVWMKMYMSLDMQDGYLYMNTEKKIYVYDALSGEMSEFADNTFGQAFYGLQVIDGKVYAVLADGPQSTGTLQYVGDCLVRVQPTTEPATEEHTTLEPVTSAPSTEETEATEPTTEETEATEPTTEEPATLEPTTLEPTTLEPSTDEPTTEPVPEPVIGDLNGDGKVTIKDITILQRFLAEFDEFTDEQYKLADMNRDGKVNVRDVTAMQRIVAEFI